MPQPDSLPQIIAGRYVLHERLGFGGMGTVYRATDRRSGAVVAIKLLRHDAIERDSSLIERFNREAELLDRLNHPNIVRAISAIETDGTHAIVMEYVPGGSLSALLRRQPQLPIDQVVEIALDLSDALARAHRLGVIHRDVKPANVLLAEDGTPRLADFGVAYIWSGQRVTQTGVAMGTADYLAPEIIAGDDADARADIWSLGVMVYEMLTGQRPFSGQHQAQVLMAIMSKPVPDLEHLRPDCPVALADLVYRMLEKDHAARISSVRLVGAEMESILGALDTGSHTQPVARAQRPAAPPADTPTPVFTFHRRRLPAQTTPFVGRETELAALESLFADPGTRLVTILAPGGMGKTRLALELAERMAGRFSGGVCFVPLAPLHTPESIVPAVAEATGCLLHSAGATARQELFNCLATRTALLVLDNFEHLLDGAALLDEIIRAAPGVQLLVTSRERLNLSFETVFMLEGMDAPEDETLTDLLRHSAVKLFLQSARRALPGYDPDEADAPHIASICRSVAGMPLALVLAAAWVPMLSSAEIATEISRGLDLFQTDAHDIPERHRSVRAVFDQTWNLLDADEQDVFAQLSVFRGGFSRQAAQTITGAPLRTLAGLVRRSLLRRSADTGRYEVHELLRQYAAERLERAGLTAAVRDAHSAYYLAALATRTPDIRGSNQLSALNDIDADFENVRAAWNWAVQRSHADAVAAGLESLYLFCEMRSRWSKAEDLFQSARQRFAPVSGAPPSALYGRLLSHHYDRAAATRFEQALEIARAHDDRAEIAFCLNILGWIAYEGGDLPGALGHFQESLALYRALDDAFHTAALLSTLGVWHAAAGQLGEGTRLLQESLALRRAIGDRVGTAETLHRLSPPLIFSGELEAAGRAAAEAHAISRETGNLAEAAFSAFTLAGLAMWRGALEEARTLLDDALGIAQEINHAARRGQALVLLGFLASIAEDYEEGRRLCAESQPLIAANPIVAYIADMGLAAAACGLRDYDTAWKHTLAALGPVAALNNRAFMLACLPCAAPVIAARGDAERAAELLALALSGPPSATGWMWRWPLLQRLHTDLEARLGAPAFDAARVRGAALDVTAVVHDLLQERV